MKKKASNFYVSKRQHVEIFFMENDLASTLKIQDVPMKRKDSNFSKFSNLSKPSSI
jgi:hypothetical protein